MLESPTSENLKSSGPDIQGCTVYLCPTVFHCVQRDINPIRNYGSSASRLCHAERGRQAQNKNVPEFRSKDYEDKSQGALQT